MALGEEKPAAEKTPAKSDETAAQPGATPVAVDFDGLAARGVRVPVESDNITALAVTADYLVYSTAGAPFNGRASYEKPKLRLFARALSRAVRHAGGGSGRGESMKGRFRPGPDRAAAAAATFSAE